MNIASIDIGTNTVLMVIAEVNPDSSYKVITQEYDVARLGEGVDKTKLINKRGLKRVIDILHRFKDIADNHKVEHIFCCGTSALRDAENKSDVVKSISDATGIFVEIISGDTEAYLTYTGAVDKSGRNFLIDIGGGSTEYIVGEYKGLVFKKSLNIGAVRITERYFDKQPPGEANIKNAEEFIRSEIESNIKEHISQIDNYFAAAGTATTIATSANGLKDHEVDKIEGYVLDYETLCDVFEKYSKSETVKIIEKYGVHPRRADLITAGTLILRNSFEVLGIKELTVSSKGLRFGFLKQKIQEIIHM